MDLLKKEDAYFYGLLLADGNLYETTRNRGKLTLELRIRDIDILYKIEAFFSKYSCKIYTRRRDTNFKKNYETCSIAFHSYELRKMIKSLGYPVGSKCNIVDVPTCPYDECSFWRGYLDGNGSFCISATGIPLVSMGIKSENLKIAYVKFLELVTNEKKNVNRNKRDAFYNIISARERAQTLIKAVGYPDSTLAINHKREKALTLLKWTRNK